jgi:hypothetical protein
LSAKELQRITKNVPGFESVFWLPCHAACMTNRNSRQHQRVLVKTTAKREREKEKERQRERESMLKTNADGVCTKCDLAKKAVYNTKGFHSKSIMNGSYNAQRN